MLDPGLVSHGSKEEASRGRVNEISSHCALSSKGFAQMHQDITEVCAAQNVHREYLWKVCNRKFGIGLGHKSTGARKLG